MNDNQIKDEMARLVKEVVSREPKRRPEAEWVQQRVDRLARRLGIDSKAKMDQWIYEGMYGKIPKKTDTVKIRYWRTGHHLPAKREEALAFAKVLQIDGQEMVYFLQAYMDKCDQLFVDVENLPDSLAPIYARRTDLMEGMLSEYLAGIPLARMIQWHIPYEKLGAYLRHLYCMDAWDATMLGANGSEGCARSHLASANYESEFLRIRKLQGEIPRRTMLRQIFLLGLPYLNRRLVDERLQALGYLPLTKGHTSVHGALVDDLVIDFLELYKKCCTGQDPLACRKWMLEQLSALDCYLKEVGKEEYRFLYFRVLSTMAG